MEKLIDIGERHIVQQIIYDVFPDLVKRHDDTVNITVPDCSTLSFSTDPCPEPIISTFDPDKKYYYYGWMSVLINYSDLAAEGVEPIGIMLSAIMPNDILELDLRSFLQGVKDACNAWGGTLLGGNIKDGTDFCINGTAIGKQRTNCNLLTRKGMKPGDVICVIGDMGMFWLAIMQLIDGCTLEKLDPYINSFVTSPYPKLKESALLAQSSIITSCMDSSDGIIGCLYELAMLNNVSIHIEDSLLIPNKRLKDYCIQKGKDYRNYMLAFGGWELVFSCKKSDVNRLCNLFNYHNMKFNIIGYADYLSDETVYLHQQNHSYKINDFSSKRFDRTSLFSFGLDSIINQLNSDQLLLKQ